MPIVTTEVEHAGSGSVEDDEESDSTCEDDIVTDYPNTSKESYMDVHINLELDPAQHRQLRKLLYEFQDIFTDIPKVTNLGEHAIHLTSSKPTRCRPYPIPDTMRQLVAKEIASMLKAHNIEPSISVFSSPIVVI